jgi:hypothetical protein
MQTPREKETSKIEQKEETSNKPAGKNVLKVIQSVAFAKIKQCVENKTLHSIPCFVSEIHMEELWVILREEILTTGTFTEKQAESCTGLFAPSELTQTVLATVRDQMVKEIKQLFYRAYTGDQFVFIKISNEQTKKPCLMLLELGMLVRDLNCFTSLSKTDRQPFVLFD